MASRVSRRERTSSGSLKNGVLRKRPSTSRCWGACHVFTALSLILVLASRAEAQTALGCCNYGTDVAACASNVTQSQCDSLPGQGLWTGPAPTVVCGPQGVCVIRSRGPACSSDLQKTVGPCVGGVAGTPCGGGSYCSYTQQTGSDGLGGCSCERAGGECSVDANVSGELCRHASTGSECTADWFIGSDGAPGCASAVVAVVTAAVPATTRGYIGGLCAALLLTGVGLRGSRRKGQCSPLSPRPPAG
jgi:hypothetical protein